MEPVTITTERFVLRPFRSADADDVFGYATDREYGRFLPLPEPYTHDDAERFVAACLLTDWRTHPYFALEHDGHVVGGINLRVDTPAARGEIGYSIARPLWGRGLMGEAAGAVMELGFAEYGLARIIATAIAENRQSWRVMEKLGMQREGYLRSDRILRGERRDLVLYGILRDEWTKRGQRGGAE